MMELKLLKLLTDRTTYDTYLKYLNKEYLEDITITILEDYKSYFSMFSEASSIDLEEFNKVVFTILRPSIKEDSKLRYQKVLDNLKSLPPPDLGILSFFREKEFYSILVEKCLYGLDKGISVIPEIETLLTKHKHSLVSEDPDTVITEDIHGLAEAVVGGTGLNWRLDVLNWSMGPLRKGNFVVVGARPEAGKTTFLASESTFMQQFLAPEESVVWFNNEEEGRKVMWRVIQSALGWTRSKMVEDLDATYAEYLKITGRPGKIVIYDSANIAPRNIEAALNKYNPGLIIFDQLRKVGGFDNDSEVLRLQKVFQYARELSKRYAPVIDVHQADGSAEGERYIEMNQLYGSKTDIQGEADAILTIGKSNEDHLGNTRFFYLPKNKLPGGPLSEEKYRHGKFEIPLQREIGRFGY